MPNPGEELVGEYLKNIKHCEFVEYNLHTPEVQGEIDVVGIDVEAKRRGVARSKRVCSVFGATQGGAFFFRPS